MQAPVNPVLNAAFASVNLSRASRANVGPFASQLNG
jgi:hypothetical protein